MPSFADKLADKMTAHAVTLERLKAGERNAVVAMLRKLEAELVARLAEIEPSGVTVPAYQQARLKKLLAQVKETIRAAYRGVRDTHAEALVGVGKAEVAFTKAAVNGLIGVDIVTAGLSAEALNALASDTLIHGAPSAEWWSRQAGDTLKRFTDTVRTGVLLGEDTPSLVRRVRGTREAGFADGIMQTAYRNAEALVRSSVQTVANEARMQTFDNNTDVVKGIQWVSTLDRRTTAICITLDGKQWDNERKPIGHSHKFPGPTAHWGCRSTQIPVLKSWSELGGKGDFSGLERDRLRASMDGQVANVSSFEDFLERKEKNGPGYVNDLLGKTRAGMWRSGKITVDQLTDQNNRPLTVKELLKLIGEGGP